MSLLEIAKNDVLETLSEKQKITEQNSEMIDCFLDVITNRNGNHDIECIKAMDFIRKETRKGSEDVVLLYEILELIRRQKQILEINGSPTQYCPETEK